jgi:hypothetical protein
MFNHRRKTIGKSIYNIHESNGKYIICEIYNNSVLAESKYTHDNIDDALTELNNIRCERYYTDNSKQLKY